VLSPNPVHRWFLNIACLQKVLSIRGPATEAMRIFEAVRHGNGSNRLWICLENHTVFYPEIDPLATQSPSICATTGDHRRN
jgi:hypothetical protein